MRLQEALAKSIKDTNDALGKSIMDSNDTLGKSIKAENQMTQEAIQKGVDDLKDVVGLIRDLSLPPRRPSSLPVPEGVRARGPARALYA